jgi:hypothetical protein
MQHTGYIIVLAYPETVVRLAREEFSSKIWSLFGVGGKHRVMAGHAAFLLVSKKTGAVHYFDFGRYVTSKGMGRVRSVKTDCELGIPAKAVFENDTIANLNEILLFVESRPEKTHGEGKMIASVNAEIDYAKAIGFIEKLQQKRAIPYGAFVENGSNCARFVCDVLLFATNNPKTIKRLRRSKLFTPSPIGNAVNGKTEVKMLEVYEQEIRDFHCDSIVKEHKKYFFKKVSQEINKYGNMMPSKSFYNPPNGQWLSGIGAGAWFEIEKGFERKYVISRRGAHGELHVRDSFLVNQSGFEIEKPYKFLHGSHCNMCWVQQRRKVYVFQRILDEVGMS